MIVPATSRLTRPRAPRLWTIADVAALPDNLPTGPARYELDNGKLIIMAPPGDTHGAVQSNIGAELKTRGERRGLGKARTEVGVILWRDPDKLLVPDAVFVAGTSLPLRKSAEGYLETIPDLVLEVVSKNDTEREINAKVKDYLKAGVRVVWVADPESKTVTAHRRGRKPRVFKEGDIVTVPDIIPGFAMPVSDVFEE